MAFNFTETQDLLIAGTLKKVGTKAFVDNVLRGIPTLKYIMDNGYRELDGGKNITVPVFLSKNLTAKAHARYEDLDLTPQDEGSNAIFDWARYNVNVAFSFDEMAKNAGRAQVINLLEGKLKMAMDSLREDMARDLFGTGDGTDDKTLVGLQRLASTSPSTQSIGRIPTTETNWRNQADTSTINFNTSTAGELAWQLGLNQCSFGARRPTLIATSQTVWGYYAKALRDRGQQPMPVGIGDSGFDKDALNFAGIPVIWDRHIDQTADLPNGPGATYAYMLDTNSIYLGYHPDFNFAQADPVRPANKAAKYYGTFWQGQLICEHRRSNKVWSDIQA